MSSSITQQSYVGKNKGSKMPPSLLVGPSWIFPETISFLVRCSSIMAICCIAEAPKIGSLEVLLLAISVLIFLLNCYEFSKPPRKVIFTFTLSALLSGASVLLMVCEASLNQQFSTEKYYTTIFESLAASGSAIIMGHFYLHHHLFDKEKKLD